MPGMPGPDGAEPQFDDFRRPTAPLHPQVELPAARREIRSHALPHDPAFHDAPYRDREPGPPALDAQGLRQRELKRAAVVERPFRPNRERTGGNGRLIDSPSGRRGCRAPAPRQVRQCGICIGGRPAGRASNAKSGRAFSRRPAATRMTAGFSSVGNRTGSTCALGFYVYCAHSVANSLLPNRVLVRTGS